VFASLLLPSLGAAAQAEYGAQAVARRQRLAATHGEDPTASGTSLDLVDRVSLPRSLGDVVREAPGARVQSTGALGAYATVSLRGADGDEALVLLDEIPLVTPDGGAFDLGLFPAELFERIDVFRGGAPVWLGSGAIGGVLRLVPRRDQNQAARLTLGAGSFGAWQLNGAASAGEEEQVAVRSQVVARGARNDYPYNDDKGTLYDRSDDEELRRKNAELTDASGYTDVTMRVLGGRLHLIALGQGRTGGFPGPASQPTPNIHRSSLRGLLGAAYERKGGGSRRAPRRRVQLIAAASYNLDRYTDLYGELGTSQRWDTDDKAYRLFTRLAATQRLARWLEATLVSSYALDHYDWHNRYTFPKPAPSTRHTAAAALELAARGNLGRIGFELRPSARVEWSGTQLHADQAVSGVFDSSRSLTIPTARVGAGVLLSQDLALTASIATGARLPTMFELFGDRGLVLPAPGLKPVTSTTYDGGLAWCSKRAHWSASSELHAFLQQRRDAIATFRTSQWQVGHQNLSQVEQKGVELGLAGALFSLLSLRGALTYLRTENQLDKRLPFRPQWVAFLRPELSRRFARGPVSSAGGSAELSYRSFVYVDQANLAFVPECRTVALGVALGLFGDRVRLAARMDDAADVRCSDLVGYPLPGRSLFFSLTYQEENHDRV
jgi:iron complex outermembrane receptor protein